MLSSALDLLHLQGGWWNMSRLRNPYKDAPPNFVTLAEAVPDFAPFLRETPQGHPTIDFKDGQALRALTTALLERDFNLKISLPTDRLCPIVPGRGTGASAIYPLLACRTLPVVRMLATDIDQVSLSSAKANIEVNALQDRIRLVKVRPDAELLPLDVFIGNVFNFCMCNPPFYSSIDDLKMSEAGKELDPFAVCTGAAVEMITPGGEVEFVTKIFKESQILGSRIQWYSSLFGKYSSIAHIVNLLREEQISNYGVMELGQGYTKRWVVAWSFQDLRLPDVSRTCSTLRQAKRSSHSAQTLARSDSTALSNLLPPPNLTSFNLVRHTSVATAAQDLRSLLSTLSLEVCWLSGHCLDVTAKSNTWSRGARRKKARGEVEDPQAAASARPLLRSHVNLIEGGGKVELEAQWTQGTDRLAFTGLWLHVVRKLSDTVKVISAEMDVT